MRGDLFAGRGGGIAGGRFVIENKVPAYDAEALAARCAEAGDRLWKRMTDMERKA